MSKTLQILEKVKQYPKGLWIFSQLLCLEAPYFPTIHPVFTILEKGRAEDVFKKRRSMQNHIGTAHAIAIANLCELVVGTVMEITLPPAHRWIPKSMKINYVAKATSDVLARTQIALSGFPDSGSVSVAVEVVDRNFPPSRDRRN
jgi:hypothetical protein